MLSTLILIPNENIPLELDDCRYCNYLVSKDLEVAKDTDIFTYPSTIRGIRNNNWGNIELPRGYKWKGQVVGPDKRFVKFADPIYGLRAIVKITRNYNGRYGIDTVEGWTDRWAPPHENQTNVYANYLIKQTGTSSLKVWDYEFMEKFVHAVCQMENGKERIDKIWHDWYFHHAWNEI